MQSSVNYSGDIHGHSVLVGPATGKGSGCARAAVGVLVCCMGQDQRSDQSFATQFTAKKGKFWTWTPLGMLAIALAVNTHSQHLADPRVWQRQIRSEGLATTICQTLGSVQPEWRVNVQRAMLSTCQFFVPMLLWVR